VSEPVTFVSLRVEAFRGFRDPREFPLTASAVIAAGPNGAGKTSFFDAIQWLLLGSLKRLESLRTKQTDEYVVNQYRLPGPAIVEADAVLNGREVRLRRSGTSRATLLEWQEGERVLRGDEAERELDAALTPSPTISLETAMLTAGLLQQDVMRSVLEAKANERFEVLNRLLGLDSLERFEQAVREWVKGANEALATARADEDTLRQRRQRIEAKLVTLEAEAAARPTAENAQADFEAAISRQTAVALRPDAAAPAMADVAADLDIAHGMLRRAVTALEAIRLEREALPPQSSEDLEQLEQALAAAQERATARQADVTAARHAALAAAERSSELARLAAVAIPLLSEICPVCGLDIDPVAVGDSLRRRVDDPGDVVALQEPADRAAQLDNEAREERDALERRVGELRRYSASRIAFALREQDAIADLVAGLEGLKVTTIAVPADSSATAVASLRSLQQAVGEVEHAAQRWVAATDVGAGAQEARRLRAEIDSITEAQGARGQRTSELARRHVDAKNLQDATVNARVAVGRRRVETLRPLVADIYNRLDPHPSFTDLDIEHDIYRKRGMMTAVAKDPLTGSEGNPILIFSSSQANIAALSYFLALGWTAGEAGVPFVLLDDPLQSMDDVNVLGFADLCRFIRTRRQLFLSTHERRFALLLGRKLAPRRPEDTTLILNFRGWDRSGPQVEVERAPLQKEEIDARLAAA
jgi:DNA repair exonuclease SbcCD ATPase subunit